MKRKLIVQTEESRLYDIAYPIIMVPWHGEMTPCRVRKLTQAQARSCGPFGMIELPEDRIRMQNVSVEDLAAYAKKQDAICKLAMVKPTYDEALKIVGAHVDSASIDRQLADIQELFTKLEKMADTDRKTLVDLRNQYAAVEVQSKFILPADFMAHIVNYSNEISASDIKLVTEEMLIDAAFLATRGNKRPSDILTGVFTDLMRAEIDTRAWILLDEHQKKKTG